MRNKPWDRSVQLTKLLFKIPFLLGGIELSNAGQKLIADFCNTRRTEYSPELSKQTISHAIG